MKGEKYKVKRWKRWFLVKDANGNTIEQFLNEEQANDFAEMKKESSCLQRVSQHFGQTIKHINVYPNW